MKKNIITVILFTILNIVSIGAQSVLIENINIIDVETGKIKKQQHIHIENEKIISISSKKNIPTDGTTIINGTDKFIMPGMIDTHIHFFQTGGLYTRPDAIDLRKVVSYEDEIQFAKDIITDNFKRYLRLGITSVMDVGGPFYNFKIRDSIVKNNLSPNVFVTGPLFSPYQPEAFSKLEDIPIEKISTLEEASALFNKMLPYKPDFIKIWYIVNKDNPAKKNFPIVKHIAELSHKNNLKLAIHATDLNTAKLAVKAGADILVHSVRDEIIDDEFAKILKKNKVTYIPTLIVSNNYTKTFFSELSMHPQDLNYANPKAYASLFDLEGLDSRLIPERFRKIRGSDKQKDAIRLRFKKFDSVIDLNLQKLQKQQINIATGTDAGNIGTMHASSYIQEIEAMQKSGITPNDIIKASTINAAKGFGLDHQIGSVTEGKLADLVILNKNPLENIQNLNTIHEVIKSGKILNISNLIKESPEQVVQRQVNAYNARNIDAFMDTYADDIKIYNFPDEISMEGKEKMRERFKDMFEKVPNLYCNIKNRIVLGNKVIDREYVRFGEKYSNVIAIYEVTNGKISKVTFLR
ncbi:amidohydrolase family protein [Aquimarina algiphila]|uniref:Amidohydrolase family protein n=1 Tax=Aquimarina algiphila TaxID=2047982 RepID=A0A554VG07_9FLAO|nr:amidohydrolase family protein [Aquimarina algiphila]TSE06253.1 amidohydrolase family protein [Aquimarina algiphila]